jgi:glutamate-1-semialdehyde 2,1-aminomutase
MAKRGCHGYASFYLNGAQGEAEIEQTVSAARESFTIIEQAMRDATVDQRLECEPQRDFFKRIVS